MALVLTQGMSGAGLAKQVKLELGFQRGAGFTNEERRRSIPGKMNFMSKGRRQKKEKGKFGRHQVGRCLENSFFIYEIAIPVIHPFDGWCKAQIR